MNSTFKVAKAWFDNPFVVQQEPDLELLVIALQCFAAHASTSPVVENELPTDKHFRFGEVAMLDKIRAVASELTRHPIPPSTSNEVEPQSAVIAHENEDSF